MSVLTRARPVSRPLLTIAPGISLPTGRAHEVCGFARLTFALLVARQTKGLIFWVRHMRADGWLNGDGLRKWIDPGRLLIIRAHRANDLLWTVEESLRAGVVPLTIVELPEPPHLTPVRRLHLAAEAAHTNPTALLLTPGNGGAQGVETRWHMATAPGWATPEQRARWHLTRSRARMEPVASWYLKQADEGVEVEGTAHSTG